MAKPKLPPGTWVERSIYRSKAFLSLRGCAAQVLVIFLSKRKLVKTGRTGKEKWVCENCNDLTFSYIEAWKRYRISKPRFTRAVDDLLAKGFFHIVHQGGSYQKDKTVYALVEDWRSWEPGTVFRKRVQDAHRGYQGKKAQEP